MKQAYPSFMKQAYHLIGRLNFKNEQKWVIMDKILICNPSTMSFDFTVLITNLATKLATAICKIYWEFTTFR